MGKILRIAATVVCMLVSAVSALSWMRSNKYLDSLYYVPANMSTVCRVEAYDGVVHFIRTEHVRPIFDAGLVIGSHSLPAKPNHNYAGPSVLNFQWVGPWRHLRASMPYWFLAFAPLVAGALLNWGLLTRFNLRHILAAVAIVAVLLTVGRWASRAGGGWQYIIW